MKPSGSLEFIRSKAKAFGRDTGGNFAIIAGLTSVAVVLSGGIALDYTRIAHTKTVMADALDAAVLAAGAELVSGQASGAELEQNFRDFFDANLEGRSVSASTITIAEFEANEVKGTISAKAKANVPTTLLALTGTKEVEIGVPAEARFSSDAVEVAMVLDVTGSMGKNGKLDALKQAAKDAVEILLPESASSDKMRIGLAPYSWAVNAGDYAEDASNNKAGKDNCVTERAGAQADTDYSYIGAPVLAATNKCPSQSVQPLTNSRSQLISQINSFKADGYTAGHIGIAWGYYMLSPNWNQLWTPDAAQYSDPVLKVAIIMTDGEFNTYYDGVKPKKVNKQQTKSSNAAEDLCTDMKKAKSGHAGITVYSVAFQAPKSAQAVLKACASPDSGESKHYFSASNAAELKEAFESIAIDITKLRLSK